MARKPLLAVRGLNAWYGESQILHGIDIDVYEGEVVSLLGRNGVGKTTTLKAILGLVTRRSGSVTYDDRELIRLSTHEIARAGIAWCPEERAIFSSLSVAENLMLPPRLNRGGMSLDRIKALFPNLTERASSQGTKLSGGEQQMLAIARILRTGARVILLDEPTEGLAPVIVQRIGEAIRAIKQEGFTVVLVEQNLHFASGVADRHYILDHGVVTDTVTAAEMAVSPERVSRALAI